MPFRFRWAILISILCITLMPLAQGHVPLGVGENDSISNAAHIGNPAKSWAIYDDIHHGGQAKYYRLELKMGERLYAGVFLARSDGFLPGMAALGPGFGNEGYIPPFVEVPAGDGYVAVNGTLNGREYEPFTPAAYYQICQLDITVNRSGTYYIAVFEPYQAGDFGIAIGYVESFTVGEWLLIPFSVIDIHLWEGQSPLLIFAPLIITVITVFAAIFWAKKRGRRVPSTARFWLGATAAALCFGTAVMTLLQMGMALSISSGSAAGGVVTLMFALVPMLVGYLQVRQAASEKRDLGARARMAVLGVIALAFWAGLLIGPVLAIVTAFLPWRVLDKQMGLSKRTG
jgi:hypothetical protein